MKIDKESHYKKAFSELVRDIVDADLQSKILVNNGIAGFTEFYPWLRKDPVRQAKWKELYGD